ncbi:hypothetical protein ACHAWU_005169 [Discostella pseudostelligera]|uniref:Transmembrane protein n=1 Tax=Discostella pseudostelligera TaxID=259834 RepID=A0ABD3N4S1_9STRA
MMPSSSSRTTSLVLIVVGFFVASLLPSSLAFVVPPSAVSSASSLQHVVSPLQALPVDLITLAESTTRSVSSSIVPSSASSSDMLVSLATLDPTTLLSDVLGGLLGSSAILAVPIIAALTIVAVIAALIVGYANPADED